MLYLGQIAVANENLFSTSVPGLIKVRKKIKHLSINDTLYSNHIS
jgi:hypothetical protein